MKEKGENNYNLLNNNIKIKKKNKINLIRNNPDNSKS